MNRAWIELDQEAILHNLHQIQGLLDPNCKVMGVMKADAYGHGACVVANFLEKNGIHDFAVATAEEGIELRKSGVEGQILILGYTSPEKIMDLLQFNLTQTIVSADYAQQLDDCCKATLSVCMPGSSRTACRKLSVHIALDTGMHRIGLDPKNVDEIAHVYQFKNLQVTGIFSHLCVADSNDPDQVLFSKMQLDVFYQALEALRAQGISVFGTHVQNSYACVNYTPQPCNYARLGILMFGVVSSRADYLAAPLDLKPVLSLRAHITAVREILPGETVGYGRTYCADKLTRIASVSIDYADGIPRSLSGGKMRALVHGHFAKQVGRVCMDQLMLDVTDIPNVRTGDVATLIGADGDYRILAEELAENACTITNELLSRLGHRLENHGFSA